MKYVRVLFFPLLVLCFSLSSYAQLWSDILAPTRAIDWSGAGATIPGRNTVCSTLNPGATAAQINTAITNCGSGQVVFLNAGTYNLSSGINIIGKSNVTLRGAGADQTFLVFTNSAGCSGLLSAFCVQGDNSGWGGTLGIDPDNTATWTGGYAKGSTQITLSNTANMAVGKPIILDQCNGGLSGSGCTGTEADTGQVYTCSNSGSNCTSIDGPAGGQRPGRGQQQIVTVRAIAGNVVTIFPPLYMPNWASSRSPGAFWASSPATGVGIENLSSNFTAAGSQADITLWNCYNCWVRGVRSIFTTRTGNGVQRNHVWLVESPHVTVRDSYFFGSTSLHSEGYGVEVFSSSDSLIENNIMQSFPSPQMINGDCAGCVVGYNFSINDANDAAFLFNSLTLHAPVEYLLAEGNIGNSFRADKFHGSHNFGTVFRNYYNGWETGITNGLIPYFNDGISRYFNAIGNVLGRTGTQTQYQCIPGGCPGGFAIYELGTATDDALTASSQMRWGNYDTVNAAVRFLNIEVPSDFSDASGNPSLFVNAVPANHNLPDSFYLNSKPSWWPVSKPWPAIGPDVTGGNISGVGGHAYTIPAQDCYSSVMGGPADGRGSALNFNADTCYSPAVEPPTGLQAVPR